MNSQGSTKLDPQHCVSPRQSANIPHSVFISFLNSSSNAHSVMLCYYSNVKVVFLPVMLDMCSQTGIILL